MSFFLYFKMKFAAIQRTSAIDFPGRVCSILFTAGCMFRCPYCHNPELIEGSNSLDESEIMKKLLERKNLVDAVSLTGGEVTLQSELPSFLQKLKKEGFTTKIDTNGVHPEMVKTVLPLLDFIAMDVKAVDAEHYEKTVKVPVKFENIRKSISLIMDSGIEYEFRTTLVPVLFPKEKIEQLGELLKGAKKLVLQQFVPTKTLDPSFQNEKPYTREELQEIKKKLEKYVDDVEIRGI
jgi:pyruvate formate lyase activating enzyme